MYKNKSFLAVIPARGGSKGIPHKNIADVNGKPLIQFTIDAALGSKYLDRVIVSTENKEIADVSRKLNAEVPFLRPETLSTDTSRTIDALIHVVEMLQQTGGHYDYLVLLQPTQPLRRSFHIDEAIIHITESDKESLVSVSMPREHPILMRTVNREGILERLLHLKSDVRRQDFPTYYKVNGAIYINKINEHFNSGTSLNDNELAYIMDAQYDSDIDDPFDLEVLKLYLNGH